LRRHTLLLLVAILIVGATPHALEAQSSPAASADFFESKIRPVLATNCYSCHSQSQLGGLRVDSFDALAKGGKRGTAIVPGDPDKSLLIQAVRQTDAELKMPMGGKLKDSEIADLAAWVKAGAVWPEPAVAPSSAPSDGKYTISPESRNFWSFQPLKTVQVPLPKDPKWSKTSIDKFVLARLEREGLKPVRPASKRDLLRRATLDLTGLPPTPVELEAFEKDPSPDAFAKVVDRLLASPHYGERWGRIWLDVARFGEDDYRSLNPNPRGYFTYPNAYLYRDWVIQAFNDDMPYDTFVKAQIAGDLLEEKVRYKMLPATGFLGLGPWYFDNGAVEVTRADERHDRVDVVTRGFLGLTVACARCHDHKYDPIPTTDYYSLAGVFLNTTYHEYPRVPKTVLAEHLKIQEEVEKKQQQLQKMQNDLSTHLSESLALQTSNYLQAVFDVTGPQKREIAQVIEQRRLDFELLDRWMKYLVKPTDKYPNKNAWQALMKKPNANAQEAKKLADQFQDEVVKVMIARRDLNEENEIIMAKSLEGTKKKKRANKPNEFITNDDFCPNCGLRLKNLPESDNNFWTEIFQRELRDSEDPNAMMAMGARQGNPGVLLFRGWGLERRIGAEPQAQITSLRKDIEETRKKLDPAYPYLHGVRDEEKPINLPVSIRGNPGNLGPEVSRHFLSVLEPSEPKPFAKGSGRLELADEILKQPVAMRVIVNRIWKGHFGTGIVDTPSNFGVTGERPTNPDLLEYLASNFARNGMSIKKLHREIMLSAVYQLSTELDQTNFAKDSGNRLYWRADRKRLDAEQLRDAVLAVAGNLDTSMGGPSADLSPSMTRRTVYGKVSRYKLDEYLQLFDFPSPNISAERRFTTTVPQQRLFLMNSDFVQVESEELAKRVAAEPDNRARVRKVYQLAFNREPTEQEIKIATDYLRAEPMREYEENKNKPPERGPQGPGGRRRGPMGNGPATSDATTTDAKPDVSAIPAGGDPPTEAIVEGAMGMGMMGGVPGFGARRGPGPAAPPPVKYEPSAWGRYVKVLLSSSEFMFIN
jgi:cytochrome c553